MLDRRAQRFYLLHDPATTGTPISKRIGARRAGKGVTAQGIQMRNSEPASAEAEGWFPRSLVLISPFIWRCVRAQITVSVVIPPVVRRVNITGNRIRVVAPQVLFGSIRARRGRDEVLVPGGRGPRAGRMWKLGSRPAPMRGSSGWVRCVGVQSERSHLPSGPW